MELSLFLAKVIGWYFLIVGAFLLSRQLMVRSLIVDILANRALIFISGIITLILGLLLVLSHNVWVIAWPLVITIIAWMVLISGLIRLFLPEYAIQLGHWWLNKSSYLVVSAIINVLIGLFLLYKGYFI